MFLWRVATKILPNKLTLARRIEGIDLHCCIYGFEGESLLHIFKDCNENRGMAFAGEWGIKYESWNVDNIQDLVKGCINPNELMGSKKDDNWC